MPAINKYTFHPSVVVRSPRNSFTFEITEQIIKDNFDQTIEKESLFLASPHLYDALMKMQKGKKMEAKDEKKLLHSLSKYFIRSSTRPTPFGLFSGICTTTWGEKSNIIYSGNINRHTRLDMNYLCALVQKISSIKEVKERLKYFANSSLYKFENEFRYVEYYFENNKRAHQISSVKKDKYINKALNFVSLTASTYHEISERISDNNINILDANDFVNQLIEMQILVSELEPTITGEEYFYRIIRVLNSINADQNLLISNLIEVLSKIDMKLKLIDENKINEIDEYCKIIELVKSLEVEFDQNCLFQVDLIAIPKGGGSISLTHQSSILEALEFLQKIDINRSETNIEKFCKKFVERFQDQEIALSLALDVENGIGYLEKKQGDFTPLIEGIEFVRESGFSFELNKNQQKLFEALIEANRIGIQSIDLNLINFDSKLGTRDLMPPSFNVLFRELEHNMLFIEAIGGSSATTLLARFAHADESISKNMLEIVSTEETYNTEIIFAEIVHLPENRTGNVLMHPIFRKYEIPFLAGSNVDTQNQIALNDLFISVKDNHLVLRSLKLNKVIIPRLSNAHNYSNDALPTYQFLCDLQCQNTHQYLNFDWGQLSNGFKFLPRVTYKSTILSLAKWVFSKSDFANITSKDGLNAFLGQNQVPNKFLIADGDNELLIDRFNDLSIEIFQVAIRSNESIVLKEFIGYSENIQNENGTHHFANQIVGCIINNQNIYQKANLKSIHTNTRNFILGSEWLYFKVYCGAKVSDDILIFIEKSCIEKAFKLKIIKSWFFIRYNDPEPHIRIRFHLSDKRNLHKMIDCFNQSISIFLKNKIIWKLQTETYEREIERYGLKTINHHEQLFNASSNAILSLLKTTEGDDREQVRWLFSLKLVDVTLELFQFDINQKMNLLNELKDSFANEFNLMKEQKLNVDLKFRENRAIIFEFMQAQENKFSKILENFKKNSKEPISEILKSTKKENLPGVTSSQIHMHLNRAISSNQRQHELIIYDFLFRYYKSIKARQNASF